MHIRMFRTDSSVHSAAVVPKASIGMFYGKYVERFRVDPDSDIGYGQAHLLWPTGTPVNYEIDFPEGDWDYNFCFHAHSGPGGKKSADHCTRNEQWAQWNTTEIDWYPGNVTVYLNGQPFYHVTGKLVPGPADVLDHPEPGQPEGPVGGEEFRRPDRPFLRCRLLLCREAGLTMKLREWVLQDWAANAGRPESQLLLAWFRLAQWAAGTGAGPPR